MIAPYSMHFTTMPFLLMSVYCVTSGPGTVLPPLSFVSGSLPYFSCSNAGPVTAFGCPLASGGCKPPEIATTRPTTATSNVGRAQRMVIDSVNGGTATCYPQRASEESSQRRRPVEQSDGSFAKFLCHFTRTTHYSCRRQAEVGNVASRRRCEVHSRGCDP